MTWIHDEEYFSEKKVREQARKYGFSDPIQIEFFLWDCEIAAQLQKESDDFILKGGAAAQLHLPVQMQRGSVDVDIVCNYTKEEIANALTRIHDKIPTVHFEKYAPKRAKKEINMVTYLAKMPPLIPSGTWRLREVKIDFLLEDLKLPTQVVKDVETFAVNVKTLKCYSVSSLIGDKILTLAENTVGITDAAYIPKQIYDVSVLSEKGNLTTGHFLEVLDAIGKLVPLEAGYRGLRITVAEALSDVEETMTKYGLLDTEGADAGIKKNVTNFQQFYVSASQKWPLYEWCARALKIRFLSQLLKAASEKKIDVKEAFNEYNLAVQIAQLLTTVKGEQIKTLNKKLMDTADTEIPYFRNLKGKPLLRVFWQVVSRNNLNTIWDLVKTQGA
jgi:hypothetical protein